MKKMWVIMVCCLLLLIGGSLLPGSGVMGMESQQDQAGGYWQLVQTVEEPGDSYFKEDWHGISCKTITASWSNGHVSHTVSHHKDKSYCDNTDNYYFSGSCSWTPPPGVIRPGEKIPHNISCATEERRGRRHGTVSIHAGVNNDYICSTATSVDPKPCEENYFIVKPGNPQLGEQGTTMEIGVGVSVSGGSSVPSGEVMNHRGYYRYIYEWVEQVVPTATMTPSATPTPSPTEVPELLYNLGGEVQVINPPAILTDWTVDFETYWPLINVKVYLLHNGNVIDQTFTNLDGMFGFRDVSVTEDLVLKVELEHAIHAPDDPPYYKVVYQEPGNLVSFSTQPFEVDPEEGKWEFYSILVNHVHELEYEPSMMNHTELVDAALTFYYLDQAWHFAALRLGLGQTLDLPFEAIIYSNFQQNYPHWRGPVIYAEVDDEGNKTTHRTEPSNTMSYISMPPDRSDYMLYNHSGTLLHEFGHHLMADVFDNHLPWNRKLMKNHDGFKNPSTNDSWMEGFATFIAAWIQRDMLELPAPHIVRFDGRQPLIVNLEENKLAWSRGVGEEFAVAALLWDLIDPINPADCTVFPVFGYATQPVITAAPDQVFTRYCDHVQLTNQQLWEILTSNHLPSDSPYSPDDYDWIWDVKDLYRNLKFSYGYYSVENNTPEFTPNQLDPIDELFISHGFFADVNPQNMAYDPGEEIGMTSNEPLTVGNDSFPARSERRVPPPPPESYIGYQLYDTRSRTNLTPEVGDYFLVEVFYDPPFELYNYSFETRAGSAGKLLYYGPAEHYAATIRVSAVGLDREPVNVLEFSNAFYWQEGYDRGEEPFINHVFEVQQQRGTGGSGGWILPAVLTSTFTLICAGLIILLGVVIVIVVKRRRRTAGGL